MEDWLKNVSTWGVDRVFVFTDDKSGLAAVSAVDSLRLGPAAGGVRTARYPDFGAAVTDACRLARAMTAKCALGGLAAGGVKTVVWDHGTLDRPRAFSILGTRIEELRGMIRTAGDLGTTAADLAAMAETTSYVHLEEADLSRAVARGLRGCIEAAARMQGRTIDNLHVGVQGAGAIGASVVRELAGAGARVACADIDASRVEALADELPVDIMATDRILTAEVDVVCPCAVGGVIDAGIAEQIQAFAVCPAANNALRGAGVADRLRARGVLLVPDIIGSAGAVIEGIGRTVMGLDDRTPLIAGLEATAETVLRRSAAEHTDCESLAWTLASERVGKTLRPIH
ncbi:MAG: Glu/Leu/Phe/Val dehydrogenase dimerization domain-containing protein [Myxococcota bacterium]